MSWWFRLDGDMVLNPKIGRLTDGEFRALLALWSYCARRRNGGSFREDELRFAFYCVSKSDSRGSQEGAKSVSRAHLRKFQEAGLVKRKGRTGAVWQIKDWAHYQPKDPTAAERMRAYRERNKERNADRNGYAPTEHNVTTTPPTPPTGGKAKMSRKELRRYTGCRYVYNGRAPAYVRDPLGVDRPPDSWPYGPPTEAEIASALQERDADIDLSGTTA